MYKRYIEVKGNPYERGLQIGRALRMQILTCYENLEVFFNKPGAQRFDAWKEGSKIYIPLMEQYTPEVLEEIRGTAEGAEMEFEQILSMATEYEKNYRDGYAEEKCTAFAATHSATKTGGAFIGQTNDENCTEWIYQVDCCIHHVDGDFEKMLYTHPGFPAYNGINNRGLALVWTYIDNNVRGNGLPSSAIISHILELGSCDEAVEWLKTIPHDVPNHFFLADKTGKTVSVECYPNAVYVDTDKDCMSHANNNVFSNEPEFTVSKSTFTRVKTMQKLLDDNCGNIDAELCKTFLANHENFPHSICSHPYPGSPERITNSAAVYDVKNGIAYYAYGTPCEHPFFEHKFNKY